MTGLTRHFHFNFQIDKDYRSRVGCDSFASRIQSVPRLFLSVSVSVESR
jgi:hypothetical protein